MAISIGGTVVIDDSRNIVNANDIRVGLVTITGSTGNIETPGTIRGGGFIVAGAGITISPGAGTTNVVPVETSSIIISFPTNIERGTGTVSLRTVSAGGTTFKSYDAATAPEITVLNNAWSVSVASTTYTSAGAAPVLPAGKQIFLVIPSTAISGFVGLNTTGADSYSFTTSEIGNLGQAAGGGFIICKSGGTQWIVSPRTAEVSRTWNCRGDSNTRSQQVSGCTGWFIPSCAQYQNPGFSCRIYWDSYSGGLVAHFGYWTNTEAGLPRAWNFRMDCNNGFSNYGSDTQCVRSFRCVSY